MTFLEATLLGLLTLLVGGIIVYIYRHHDPTVFWSPLTLFAGLFSYYFIFGPTLALVQHNTTAYGMELRELMWKAWLAGLLGLASICVGFAIRVRPFTARLVTGVDPALRRRLWFMAATLLALGLIGFVYNAYVSGQSLAALLLPFHRGGNEGGDNGIEREGMAAGSYLYLLINTFIPGLCLLTVLQMHRPWAKRWAVTLIPTALVVLFYLSVAFRHRIVILLLALVALHYLLQRKRPNPATLGFGALGMVLLSGFITLTRTYGRGLDLSQVGEMSLVDVLLGGFSDSRTFFTTALVVDSYPTTFAFVGLNPVWIALTIPIPRALWPEKPYTVMLEQFSYLTGTNGQAVPVTGEHYMMAGWIGVIVGGILIGLLYRGFWEFYRANPGNPFVVAMYAVAWALIFPVVNRGYLAQTCMEFFFDFLPLVLFFLISRNAMYARSGSTRRTAPVPGATMLGAGTPLA